MTVGRKISAFLFLAIAVWQVSITGSERLMKGYNFTGPNAGPVPRREADNARRTLYFMAGGAAVGLLLLKDKKA